MSKINIQFTLFSAFYSPLIAAMAGGFLRQEGYEIGPCAFSSLAASRDWLRTEEAGAFVRAYGKARLYLNETPAAEIASAEKPYFPDVDESALASCIAAYQELGCWTPHVEITRDAYEVTLDVFQYAGIIDERYPYERVCAPPPGDA